MYFFFDNQKNFDGALSKMLDENIDYFLLRLTETIIMPCRFIGGDGTADRLGYSTPPANDAEAAYQAGRMSVYFDLMNFFKIKRDERGNKHSVE